jgi:hypothetical protein
MPHTSKDRTRFECADLILWVADMSRSLNYYVNVFGFTRSGAVGIHFLSGFRPSAIFLCKHLNVFLWLRWKGARCRGQA